MALVKNVLSFIDWCSKEIGKFEEDKTNANLWNECQDLGIESPIEHLLYCALATIRQLNYCAIAEGEPTQLKNGDWFVHGLNICPQYKIGNYRTDFYISFGRFRNEKPIIKEVIVECDSQKFHDRTEKERRYEKVRDRFLQAKGYRVFHYTGAEITQKPMSIAAEIISFVTGIDFDNIQQDSNIE